MQDRYVGDVGDFGKYGLLRRLCPEDQHGPALRLGVLWYRFDGNDLAAPNDGKHIQYLTCCASSHERRLRDCDPELFCMMLDLVNNERSIAAVEAKGILPADTVFFNDGLNFDTTPIGERCEKRTRWLSAGIERVKTAEIVFVDPDNGLQVPSQSRHRRKGPKYVYYDDLLRCWDTGQSLIVYHHIGRTYNGRGAGVAEQVRGRAEELKCCLPSARPIALRYRRRSSRIYFVLPNPSRSDRLEARIRAFLNSPWGSGSSPHFQRVEC